jgi:hypothetical protein
MAQMAAPYVQRSGRHLRDGALVVAAGHLLAVLHQNDGRQAIHLQLGSPTSRTQHFLLGSATLPSHCLSASSFRHCE